MFTVYLQERCQLTSHMPITRYHEAIHITLQIRGQGSNIAYSTLYQKKNSKAIGRKQINLCLSSLI